MKRMMNLAVAAFLMAFPIASKAEIVAYSPSIGGMPLIFHFESMNVTQFSAATWVQIQNALLIQSSYSNRLEDLYYSECCGPWNIWVDGMGQWLHQDTDPDEQFGYENVTGVITLGTDKCYQNFLVGGAFSYTYSSLQWDESAGDGQINSYYGGVYGDWNDGLFYVNSSLLGAFNDYHTSRHLIVGFTERQANVGHNGWEFLAGVESGVLLKDLSRLDFVPFAGIDYVYLSQQGYTEEDGGNSNLNVDSRSDQLLQSQIGIQFIRRIPYRSWIIAPNLTLSYINQTPLTGDSYEIAFIRIPHEFTLSGWNFERNLGSLAFSLNFLNCEGLTNFALRYEGQYGGDYWTQTGSLRCNFHF